MLQGDICIWISFPPPSSCQLTTTCLWRSTGTQTITNVRGPKKEKFKIDRKCQQREAVMWKISMRTENMCKNNVHYIYIENIGDVNVKCRKNHWSNGKLPYEQFRR
jgi:hypothetical protein